ncbi:hypothetical protein GVAV_003524 [Gurleya vavrai]
MTQNLFSEPESQLMPEKPRKHRGTETLNVIKQQNIAVREYKDLRVRKFREEYVDVETIGGHPIRIKCWVSDEKPQVKRPKPKEPEMIACDICGREFDERRKMLIHARSHKTKAEDLSESVKRKQRGNGNKKFKIVEMVKEENKHNLIKAKNTKEKDESNKETNKSNLKNCNKEESIAKDYIDIKEFNKNEKNILKESNQDVNYAKKDLKNDCSFENIVDDAKDLENNEKCKK